MNFQLASLFEYVPVHILAGCLVKTHIYRTALAAWISFALGSRASFR